MSDIYKLYYFIEKSGLLIQEKWYKATHPEVWDCNQRNSEEIEECPYEDILEDESMASSPGHMEGSEGLFVNSMDAEVGRGIKEERKVSEPDDSLRYRIAMDYGMWKQALGAKLGGE